MPTISDPNRICKKFRQFKRIMKVRIGETSGVITVKQCGWERKSQREQGGMRGKSSGPGDMERGLSVCPGNPVPLLGPIQFPCWRLCRCSGADCESALLIPFRLGTRLSTQNPPSHGGRTGLGLVGRGSGPEGRLRGRGRRWGRTTGRHLSLPRRGCGC